MSDRSECAVAVRSISQRFGTYTALDNLTFDISRGRFVSIVGPSGCGKSTLLHVVAGLLAPSDGRVEIFGQPLTGINRRASYMFQQDALLPWKTVVGNIQLGLTLRGHDRREATERAKAWVERVGLHGFGQHYPHQLSGGMRKRVTMAQAWIVQPDLILMGRAIQRARRTHATPRGVRNSRAVDGIRSDGGVRHARSRRSDRAVG